MILDGNGLTADPAADEPGPEGQSASPYRVSFAPINPPEAATAFALWHDEGYDVVSCFPMPVPRGSLLDPQPRAEVVLYCVLRKRG